MGYTRVYLYKGLFITIMDEYKTGIKSGSVLRPKGVGEMDMVDS